MLTDTQAATATRCARLPTPPTPVVIILGVLFGLLCISVGTSAALAMVYENRVYPHVAVFGVDVGGLATPDALEAIQKTYDAMLDRGLVASIDGQTATIPLRSVSEEATISLIDLNVSKEVENAMAVGRTGSIIQKTFLPIFLASGVHVNNMGTLAIDAPRFAAAITDSFPDIAQSALPVTFSITKMDDTWNVEVVPGTEGVALDVTAALLRLHEDTKDLRLATLNLATVPVVNDVRTEDAERLIPDVRTSLTHAPYILSFTPEGVSEPLMWEITADDLALWLAPAKDERGDIALTLSDAGMHVFLSDIHDAIDIPATNARFAMENGRVTEFAGSKNGIMVDDEATIEALINFLGTDASEILVAATVVEPTVTTANVNNLGITEVLGVGASNFAGSPTNRIANIQHGAEKLNGLLVAPGETISLLEQLRPFTTADGYLPELVIKGDEIKPEVGGGLCQIGTTTFRAVMNAGLKVVERRNHSLVVSYYNDPLNGNPGTDATIYDPSPDFQFMNDTTNYLLLATEVDLENKQLFFTFWGTPDGRKGEYEPPTVLSWSGYGATVTTETDALEPGITKCQSPHPGATTTFTYRVTYADGSVHEEEFTSSYRSLAQICLVGKTAATDAATETTTGTVTAPETTTVQEQSPSEETDGT